MTTPADKARLQEIDDEISINLDNWYDYDQHFDSALLDRVHKLREERNDILRRIALSYGKAED